MSDQTPEVSTADVVLFEKSAKLSNGQTVYIKPWGITMGKRLSARLTGVMMMFRAAATGGAGLGEMVSESYDEIVGIVGDSFDMDLFADDCPLLLEDLLVLTRLVIEVNFTERPSLGKALTDLLAVGQELVMDESLDEPSTS